MDKISRQVFWPLMSPLLQQLNRPTLPRDTSHCILQENDKIGEFRVTKPLGQGRFSRVWAASDNVRFSGGATVERDFAIKIYRTGQTNSDYFSNEIYILNKLAHIYDTKEWPQNIVAYYGTFVHVALDNAKKPCMYPCIVFERVGNSLSGLLKYCLRKYERALPIDVVKKIMRETMTGLSHLHAAGIIHTDIKPSNLLLSENIEDICISNREFYVVIADLGSSTVASDDLSDLFSKRPGTTNYMAPELMIDSIEPYNTAIDIWSACAMCYELITGDLLFDVYAECDITYGEDVDCEALEGLVSDCSDEPSDHICIVCEGECTCSDNPSNDVQSISISEDENSSGSEGDIDYTKLYYRMFMLMVKVLGYPPGEFAQDARQYFNRRDRLKNHPNIEPSCISDLLGSHMEMDYGECCAIEAYITAGLQYMPNARFTANDAANHAWTKLCEK